METFLCPMKQLTNSHMPHTHIASYSLEVYDTSHMTSICMYIGTDTDANKSTTTTVATNSSNRTAF